MFVNTFCCPSAPDRAEYWEGAHPVFIMTSNQNMTQLPPIESWDWANAFANWSLCCIVKHRDLMQTSLWPPTTTTGNGHIPVGCLAVAVFPHYFSCSNRRLQFSCMQRFKMRQRKFKKKRTSALTRYADLLEVQRSMFSVMLQYNCVQQFLSSVFLVVPSVFLQSSLGFLSVVLQLWVTQPLFIPHLLFVSRSTPFI